MVGKIKFWANDSRVILLKIFIETFHNSLLFLPKDGIMIMQYR